MAYIAAFWRPIPSSTYSHMYYTLPCYVTSVIEGFYLFFFNCGVWGNIITHPCQYIYGRVGSQWKIILDTKGYCTMHILLNYLTIFDDFWMMEQCYLQDFPGSKTIKIVRCFRSICIVQYYLWAKNLPLWYKPLLHDPSLTFMLLNVHCYYKWWLAN